MSAAKYAWCALLGVTLGVAEASGQQTTVFTYQGQLTNAGQPANGNFDAQFALFATLSGGAQIGSTQTVSPVPISNGVFTAQLDFGVSAFPGANRFLEISIRPTGGSSYTTLAPRQQISSTPYAIRTLSAASADALSNACVGCVTDAQIGTVAGSKVTGTIPVASVPTGSGNYVQNTTAPQPNSNFNISGNGTVGGNLTVNGTLNANVSGNFIQNRTTPQANANFDVSGNGALGGGLSANSVGVGTSANPSVPLDVNGTGWFTGNSTPLPAAAGKGIGIGFDQTVGYVFAFDYGIGSAQTLLLNPPGGNVGIGTSNPTARLEVDGTSGDTVYGVSGTGIGVHGASNTYQGVFGHSNMQAGVVGESNGFYGVFGVSHSNTNAGVYGENATGTGIFGQSFAPGNVNFAGVYGKSTGSDGIGVTGEADVGTGVGVFGVSTSPTGFGMYGRNDFGGLAMYAEGNTAQALSSGGWVKAMVAVAEGGTITRCYNSQPFDPGRTHCGFTSTPRAFPLGTYDIDFGFPVDDRFWLVSPGNDSHGSNIAADSIASGAVITVFTFYPDQNHSSPDSSTNAPFVLIVF